MLANFQAMNEDPLPAGQVGPAADDTYRAYISRIFTRGLEMDRGVGFSGRRSCLRLSPELLGALKRLPACDVDDFFVQRALHLAVRLPVDRLPGTEHGFRHLSEAATAVDALEEEFDFDESVWSGYGFGLSFSDAEMADLFEGVDFDFVGTFRDWHRKASRLAVYGAWLAGRRDWVEDFFGADFDPARSVASFASDFSALKRELLEVGIVETAEKARKLVADLALKRNLSLNKIGFPIIPDFE